MQAPITEFFDDEPIVTPEKSYKNKNIVIDKKIKTAVCVFLCEHLDKQLLEPILNESKFVLGVFGRSGKTPVYQYKDTCLIVLMTVGSPVSVAVVEELKYLGIKNIIAFGSAGLLDASISEDTFIFIDKAIRDEGASYHYLPASIYIDTDKELTDTLQNYFIGKVKTKRGITWTCDALYRETARRMSKRVEQGAVVVEMECAGFAAASKRLGIRFAEFVYFSDKIIDNLTWSWLGGKIESNKRRTMKVDLLYQIIKFCDEINLHKFK